MWNLVFVCFVLSNGCRCSGSVGVSPPTRCICFLYFLVLHVCFHPAGMIHFHTDFLWYFLAEIPNNTFSLEPIKKTGQPPKYVSFTLHSKPQGQLKRCDPYGQSTALAHRARSTEHQRRMLLQWQSYDKLASLVWMNFTSVRQCSQASFTFEPINCLEVT